MSPESLESGAGGVCVSHWLSEVDVSDDCVTSSRVGDDTEKLRIIVSVFLLVTPQVDASDTYLTDRQPAVPWWV